MDEGKQAVVTETGAILTDLLKLTVRAVGSLHRLSQAEVDLKEMEVAAVGAAATEVARRLVVPMPTEILRDDDEPVTPRLRARVLAQWRCACLPPVNVILHSCLCMWYVQGNRIGKA